MFVRQKEKPAEMSGSLFLPGSADEEDVVNHEMQKAASRPLQKNFRALTNDLTDLRCLDYLYSEDVIDFDLLEQIEAKEKSGSLRGAVRLLLMGLVKIAQREKTCRVARELQRSLQEAGDGMAHLAQMLGRSIADAEADLRALKGQPDHGRESPEQEATGKLLRLRVCTSSISSKTS